MENTELLKDYLQKELSIELAGKMSLEQLKEQLSQHISYLINHNFRNLVNLLYRIDVNEARLRLLLNENTAKDAARIISGLIIERQLQKIKTRNYFKANDAESDEEKW